jgi:putative ABC transport system ATP-binding protein
VSPPQVQFSNVSKLYGADKHRALNCLNFELMQGEFVAVMGPSGCGKSTLLNLIAGIDQPSCGEVLFNGNDLSLLSDDERTRLRADKLGYIFQFFNLLSTLTVRENVLLPLQITGRLKSSAAFVKVDKLLDQVGMSSRANFYPAQLSGGEMQRVAVARAMVGMPALILADEPTGNLDSENGAVILQMLADANEQFGITIFMATHSDEAASQAKRRILMRDGTIVSEL